MGHFTYSDGVAVWKLIYYVPTLFASIFVAHRHGFAKGSGWIYLTIFCIVQIVGSIAQIVLISDPQSHGANTTALICSVLGLSPLLLASLDLLGRIYYTLLRQPWSTIFSLVILKLVQTPAAVGLILCIVGATSANSPTVIDDQVTVKIGVVLFTAVFAILCLLCLIASVLERKTKRREGEAQCIIVAVAMALPFLLVRLIYALVATFSHNINFAPGNGSTAAVTISLFMEVMEECMVVLIYIATGLKLSAVPTPDAGRGETLAYRFGRGDFNGGKLGLLSLGAALVGGAKKSKKQANRPGDGKEYQGTAR
ncbi:hypothetical protein LTR10_023427 [Elasticomyces elasticus]|uniref:DUF7702 domain-containing protein n=1 Tax=Exophiala sideris TaxID=1016849 RepID=A0ABR0J6C7_9EURO|nr:hypothetical protein LTR10_023427 [Elasticomyces elasticus]KAK5028289.1 hypothetical protein LTS07_006380 [Exophiala sideris]KAK5036066.1 hypothetical protein LTR13_005636 [Exophiala sideris]KAK5057103.1 hypothetical protein LTR69_007741 [Exophiala sideris]KAK5181510.1 hypothetical protein LTR44_006305 [Eurotiomycetes sp. CCFEE 6388]